MRIVAYGAVRRVHSFFPYNVTDARRSVLCVARYVFLQRTLKPWEARVGALGGARAAIRAQYGPPVDPYGVSDRVAVLGNYL